MQLWETHDLDPPAEFLQAHGGEPGAPRAIADAFGRAAVLSPPRPSPHAVGGGGGVNSNAEQIRAWLGTQPPAAAAALRAAASRERSRSR